MKDLKLKNTCKEKALITQQLNLTWLIFKGERNIFARDKGNNRDSRNSKLRVKSKEILPSTTEAKYRNKNFS